MTKVKEQKNSRSNLSKIVGVLAVVVVMIIGIFVVACGEDYSSEIAGVQNSMTEQAWDSAVSMDYEAGKLNDGVAVLVGDLAAYWVKDDVLYAANGFAMTWSPSLDIAPDGIDFDTVEDAVK